jgi:two-component system, sensor histidine kinase and response regulator
VTDHALPPAKVLLVDDLAENLVALRALLRDEGVELLEARSGREALELLLAHEVALALVDVQMPELDGFELAELMRGSNRTRHVPIIFVTAGSSEPRGVFRGYDAGAVDFLFKPVDPRVLRHKVATFCELYRQRQLLARQARELEETLRLNETFVAAVSHDLRNPLNAILVAAEMLAGEAPADLRPLAERVCASGRRMAGLLDDLNDLARARLAKGIPLEFRDADLGDVARKVVAEHESLCPECEFGLSAEGDLRGRWDDPRLEQVLSNLLGNAARHRSTGTRVSVRLDGGKPDRVELSVHNEGSIDPALLPQIFDPFRSGKGAQGRSSGLGLGLYIVDQIVRGHGGHVAAISGDDGVTFRVVLPRVASPGP